MFGPQHQGIRLYSQIQWFISTIGEILEPKKHFMQYLLNLINNRFSVKAEMEPNFCKAISVLRFGSNDAGAQIKCTALRAAVLLGGRACLSCLPSWGSHCYSYYISPSPDFFVS